MLPHTHSVLGNPTAGHRKLYAPAQTSRHSERAKADRSLPTLRETAGSGVRAGGALKHQVRLPVIKQNVKSIYIGRLFGHCLVGSAC